jgi:hypothetical protein
MSKRINSQLKQFFEEKPLTSWEKTFILGCIKAQDNSWYGQLTTKQWTKVLEIKRKYNDNIKSTC